MYFYDVILMYYVIVIMIYVKCDQSKFPLLDNKVKIEIDLNKPIFKINTSTFAWIFKNASWQNVVIPPPPHSLPRIDSPPRMHNITISTQVITMDFFYKDLNSFYRIHSQLNDMTMKFPSFSQRDLLSPHIHVRSKIFKTSEKKIIIFNNIGNQRKWCHMNS